MIDEIVSKISHHPRAGTGIELHQAGSLIPAHLHDDDQVVYLTVGFLIISTAKGSWFVAPDRAIVIPAGTWHEYRVHRQTRIRTFGLGDVDHSLGSELRFLRIDALTRQLLDSMTDRSLSGEAAVHAHRLIRVMLGQAPEASVLLPVPANERLARACSEVEDALEVNLPLRQVASRVGISERQLSRLFHSEFGMSYPQWRARLRVSRAASELLESKSITQVAMSLGWATPSAFTSAFTAIVGFSPSQYRRRAG